MAIPETPTPLEPPAPGFEGVHPSRQAYGLGLYVQDLSGEHLLAHGGAIFGGVSHLIAAPERGFGIMVMANTEGSLCVRTLAYALLEHHLGRPPSDWLHASGKLMDEESAKAAAVLEAITPRRNPLQPFNAGITSVGIEIVGTDQRQSSRKEAT